MPAERPVRAVVTAVATPEGQGMVVRRVFPTPRTDDLDPFLLLDELGPSELPPGFSGGFPDHPHRGFETVTYLLAGEVRHADSQGNRGDLGPGDVQWMTAGAGIVHSELPSPDFVRQGGLLHGFQLWVNLPRAEKMTRPRYQDIAAERIPIARSPDGAAAVRVIAGEAFGARAVIETRFPVLYLHVTLHAGAAVALPVHADFNAFAYVFEGEARLGGRPVARGQVAFYERGGDRVGLASEQGGQLLLVAGPPLGEPVARYGPFVMNEEAELAQAFRDFQSGRMGRIPARRD